MAGNEERNAEILRRRRAGEFPSDIAKSMGLSRNAVIGVCGRAGVALFDRRASLSKHISRGEGHGRAKLTADAVRAARLECAPYSRASGLSALARKYGVSRDAMEKAVSGQTWAHVR